MIFLFPHTYTPLKVPDKFKFKFMSLKPRHVLGNFMAASVVAALQWGGYAREQTDFTKTSIKTKEHCCYVRTQLVNTFIQRILSDIPLKFSNLHLEH